MPKAVRTLLILATLPPTVLFGLHGLTKLLSPADVNFAIFGVAVGAILAIYVAVINSGWRWPTQLLVALTYTTAIFIALPTLALLVACASGDCL